MAIPHTWRSILSKPELPCQKSPMNCLRAGAGASVIFALFLCAPFSAFAQRAHKFVDTFDQRYPVEPTAPSAGVDAPQNEPPAPHQPAKPPETQKVITREKRAIRLKRPSSRSVVVSRSYAQVGTNYVPPPIYSEWVVIRWASGDCKIWHNDTNLPLGYGWNALAFTKTYDKAFLKMMRLYHRGDCV